MGGDRNQWHGQSAAAPVPTAVPPGGRMVGAKAQRPFERVCPHHGGQADGAARRLRKPAGLKPEVRLT
jgi:hypothetical protein